MLSQTKWLLLKKQKQMLETMEKRELLAGTVGRQTGLSTMELSTVFSLRTRG